MHHYFLFKQFQEKLKMYQKTKEMIINDNYGNNLQVIFRYVV